MEMTIQELKKKAIEDIRREQILKVALQLFYKNGYSKTKVSEIAAVAGISKGLIYHYFKNKSEILFAFKDQMEVCLNECKSQATPRDCILTFTERLLANPDESGYIPPLRIYLTVFMTDEIEDSKHENPIYSDFPKTFFYPLFKKGIESNQFRPGDAMEYASIFWHILLGYTIDNMRNPQTVYCPKPENLIAIFE